MVLDGVTTSSDDDNDALIAANALPIETAQVLASCHSLIVVDNDLVGDPLEKAAFEVHNPSIDLDFNVPELIGHWLVIQE